MTRRDTHGTVIYTVDIEDEDGGRVAYPTLAEARTARSECEAPDGAIRRFVIAANLPRRRLLCALFNRVGFVVADGETEIVGPVPEREADEDTRAEREAHGSLGFRMVDAQTEG